MKKIIIILFIFISFKIFSFEFVKNNFYFTLNLYSSDNTSDLTDDKSKKENPITKDIDFGWFKEKYRLEKILIASGVITMTIGVPILIAGLVNYFLPFADKSNVSDLTSLSLIGVGSGLIGCGSVIMIVGIIRLNVLKQREKNSITFFIGMASLSNYKKF